MSSSNCCFLTCIQVFQEAGKVVWYSHLFKNFPQFFVIHTVKGFRNAKVNIMGVVCLAAWNKSERGVKWIHTPHVQARQESSWTGGLGGCDRVSEVGLGL